MGKFGIILSTQLRKKGCKMEIVLLVHILCIIAGCYFGAQKGRTLFGFLLGTLFGVLGLIVLMFFPKRKNLEHDEKAKHHRHQ